MAQERRTRLTVLVLGVLLVVALGYIVVEKYNAAQAQQQFSLVQQGAQLGYQQAISQLLQQVATCQAVPVTFENVTLNVVAVECLQQQQAQQ